MSEPDSLPRRTPEWLRRLLCELEVDMEQRARNSAPPGFDVLDVDEWASCHRTEAHQRLRAVLYGPEEVPDT